MIGMYRGKMVNVECCYVLLPPRGKGGGRGGGGGGGVKNLTRICENNKS